MPQKPAWGEDNPRSGLQQSGRLTAEQVEMVYKNEMKRQKKCEFSQFATTTK